MIKQFFVRWLIALMVMPGFVQAQAVPASTMQRAISGIVQTKMASRGFASNDPRWGATLQSGGSAIAGSAAAAAAVTAAGVTAPAWITAGAVIVLGAVFTAGINLAIDGIKWLFNGDGSVTVDGTTTAPSQKGADTWSYSIWKSGSPQPVATAWAQDRNSANPNAGQLVLTRCDTAGSCWFNTVYSDGRVFVDDYRLGISVQRGVAYTCDGLTVNSVCQPPAAGGTGPVKKSPTDAVAALSAADKAKPLNPQIVASIADQAWKNAASQPGYSGYPYDAANPVTAADASAWQSANPSAWPTVGDAVAPQPSSGAFTLPNSAAEPAPGTGTNTPPPQTGPTFDWAIPNTGEQVQKQAVSVAFVPTVFSAPTGCPAPVTFSMFGKPYSIGYGPFCDLMATLAPIFLACGAAAAALIFAESLKS